MNKLILIYIFILQYNATAAQVNYSQPRTGHHVQHLPVAAAPSVPIEQPLPAVASSQAVQQLQMQQQQQQQHQNQNHQTQSTPANDVAGCNLPRNFATYCHNNYETWRPALFLEEPDDPTRRCHYAKKQVYPSGMDIEFSPEELKAKKYKLQQEAKKQEQQRIAQEQLQKQQLQQQQLQQNPQQIGLGTEDFYHGTELVMLYDYKVCIKLVPQKYVCHRAYWL